MAEPLSLVASIVAVIGAANAAIRTSLEVLRFLTDIKDAPAEVERLRDCLRETTLLVETSKSSLEDLKRSTSLSSSSQETLGLRQALTHFTSAIKALDRELISLVAIARKYNEVSRAWGRIKWIFDEKKVARSLQRLESSKSLLNTALLLVGRCVRAIIHLKNISI